MAAGPKLTESRILIDSISGLKSIIGQLAAGYGKPPVPVASVAGSWDQREIAQQFGEVKYPFLAITLQRFARNSDSYNDNLRRGGVYTSREDSNLVQIYRLIPIIANFRVRYLAQNFDDTLAFSSRWLLRQKDQQFMLEGADIAVKVKVRLTDDLSMPEQTQSDWGNIFTLETDANMETYIGEIETRSKIKRISLGTNLWGAGSQTVLPGSETQVIDLTDTD